MMTSYFNLLKYAATGIASPDMTYFDKMRASTLMGGAVQTLTGIPPLTFKADGTPLISWSMKGNGQQQGTPTPDSPVMPTFCGARTAQLFDKSTVTQGYYISDTNGEMATGSTYANDANASDYIPISGDSVTIYSNPAGKWRWGAFYDGNKTYISGIAGYNRTLTIPENARYMRLTVVDEILDTLMVNLGSTALPYEPFGYKIPISCGGQTTPVYLGQVQTVRRIRKLVLTGSETIGNYNGIIYLQLPDDAMLATMAPFSTHFIGTNLPSADAPNYSMKQIASGYWGGRKPAMQIKDSKHNSSGLFQNFLASEYAAGTPVVIWYVLANEQTGIVNEPLCKIGDYADELHSEDAGVSIPTVKGSNVLTVDTPIQPSEMSITYKG